ncbi:glycine cleavage system protein GcvH [Paramicrobacterium agarici]|uniref:Glycine cleavage system H protein n=1 Tax=Paramicrobacterium agarici TaxID=630514 RepID=A0A2A9DZD6_9MICO|nr:glycine cleavage system protein GcvH [Microbacterium agarici]PFG31691.1 glycine cleavage system H protein [Microbacterium agarici]TQO21595.1 glycine cleavage system H protein [Microbacterium agarici]
MTDTSALSYTEDHEWLRIEGSSVTVGITDYAAEQLGDVVFVELPDVGDEVEAGTVVGEIESTKSVGELFAPATGTVTAINDAVVDDPSLVNSSPFDQGWMLTIDVPELPEGLLDADAYAKLVSE